MKLIGDLYSGLWSILIWFCMVIVGLSALIFIALDKPKLRCQMHNNGATIICEKDGQVILADVWRRK